MALSTTCLANTHVIFAFRHGTTKDISYLHHITRKVRTHNIPPPKIFHTFIISHEKFVPTIYHHQRYFIPPSYHTKSSYPQYTTTKDISYLHHITRKVRTHNIPPPKIFHTSIISHERFVPTIYHHQRYFIPPSYHTKGSYPQYTTTKDISYLHHITRKVRTHNIPPPKIFHTSIISHEKFVPTIYHHQRYFIPPSYHTKGSYPQYTTTKDISYLHHITRKVRTHNIPPPKIFHTSIHGLLCNGSWLYCEEVE